jgi:uncharacterized ion transporter superfamily protein YfcC
MAPRRHGPLDPVVMMMAALALAIVLTWIVPSGSYARAADGTALPGSYHGVSKVRAGPVDLFLSLPLGMAKSAGLIFMIMFLGGMFGVFRESGALEAAVEKTVDACGGRMRLVAPFLMLAISAGSTFLGLASEYLLIIPIALALAARMGRTVLFGFALVTISSKIGYLASVTNPVILMIAQPIAGVPAFSGLVGRLFLWLLFLGLGIAALLWTDRREAQTFPSGVGIRMDFRKTLIVVIVGAAVVLMVVGSSALHWHEPQFGAFYVLLAVVIGAIAGFSPRRIAGAFVEGMKSMVLACLVVGMAGAIEVVLVEARVLDSVVHGLAGMTEGLPRVLVGEGLVGVEMVLTLLIPSSSAKAAVSMPILVPIARLAGISGQTTVLAYLIGNGLVNMISPTSSMLLAYLATAQLPFSTWFRFILPLFALLAVLGFVAIAIAVQTGY